MLQKCAPEQACRSSTRKNSAICSSITRCHALAYVCRANMAPRHAVAEPQLQQHKGAPTNATVGCATGKCNGR
jgi:hypothetical protein